MGDEAFELLEMPNVRWLHDALLFTFLVHVAAMGTMGLFLIRGIPGGIAGSVAQRAAYVGGHPWLWRAGWLGWQVTALSDLLLAVALVATRWIYRPASIATLVLTIAGLIPDQYGQWMWTWSGPALARAAVASGHFGGYLAFEIHTFHLVAGWGAIGYLGAALGWTWCFAAAGVWSRTLSWVSIGAWGLFGVAAGMLFLPAMFTHPLLGMLISGVDGVAFVLLLIWVALVDELLLRRVRPITRFGSGAMWKHPSPRLWARACELLANSRFVRGVFELLPILPMGSEIRDVVYVNYLVPAEKLEPLVPAQLQLQRVGADDAYAVFTFLTYRHGHFGPLVFGPLRRLWPSPIQSNWRIYVVDPQTGQRGVHFVTTAITSTPHALASRLLSEGVPMHVPGLARLVRDANGVMRVEIEPSGGSAPDVRGEMRVGERSLLSGRWSECFGSWDGLLGWIVPQNRALAAQPWYGRVVRQEIDLEIALDACVPLVGEVRSAAAVRIGGESEPVCFLVPEVLFRFYGERFDPRRVS